MRVLWSVVQSFLVVGFFVLLSGRPGSNFVLFAAVLLRLANLGICGDKTGIRRRSLNAASLRLFWCQHRKFYLRHRRQNLLLCGIARVFADTHLVLLRREIYSQPKRGLSPPVRIRYKAVAVQLRIRKVLRVLGVLFCFCLFCRHVICQRGFIHQIVQRPAAVRRDAGVLNLLNGRDAINFLELDHEKVHALDYVHLISDLFVVPRNGQYNSQVIIGELLVGYDVRLGILLLVKFNERDVIECEELRHLSLRYALEKAWNQEQFFQRDENLDVYFSLLLRLSEQTFLCVAQEPYQHAVVHIY